MLNNGMSGQEYVCVQHIYACAQSLKSVCARSLEGTLGPLVLRDSRRGPQAIKGWEPLL